MRRHGILCLLAAGVLTACAAPGQRPGPPDEDLREFHETLVCQGEKECALWWRRTQYWISTNARMKIQSATDTVIETYGVPDWSRGWAFAARKEPVDADSSNIRIVASCGRYPLCAEHPVSVIAKAKRYIRSGN